MKRCNACGEEFEDKFSFCPVDATPLNSLAAALVAEHALLDSPAIRAETKPGSFAPAPDSTPPGRGEFRLTMIDGTSLLDRLAKEFRFLAAQVRLAWPALKQDPAGFSKRAVLEVGLQLRRAAQPNSLAGLTAAILLVLSAVLLLVLLGNGAKDNDVDLARDTGERAEFVEFLPTPDATKEDPGAGANGSGGRVGFARGGGEGSAPQRKKASGGGGGGNHDPLPAQGGKVPPPSEVPAPIPKFPPAKPTALPVAGMDLDPALWKNMPMAVYGDPRSKSSAPSNGPGADGGMGTAKGTGIGEGLGPGVGPGTHGNMGGDRKGLGSGGIGGSDGNNPDPDRIISQSQVTERARVLMKPEPQYTEAARKNGVTGSVVLRVVFSRSGAVTNIRALQTLPFGLTERAIMAARMIRFRPATKDGLPVNVSIQLEYNFNLY